MRGETILLDEKPCSVTTQRFIIGNQTFAVANVSSVRVQCASAWRIPWVLVAGVGVFMAMNPVNRNVGIGIAVIGLLLLLAATDEYAIILTAAGGEVTAFKSKNKKQAERILDALNRAIVSR